MGSRDEMTRVIPTTVRSPAMLFCTFRLCVGTFPSPSNMEISVWKEKGVEGLNSP